ncbi:hypothetical protein EDC65_2426 [Stella humosa]|uniref:Uncharacterized protein n=1 Tax=Stella humosa TaxID=94 RepID=A0A3N1LMY8_9PROT|nr:hypothetical protein EDC65_2426 [Stella humosa]BBK29530.1 hypothetical protein STHU_01640 [Stella humosa]
MLLLDGTESAAGRGLLVLSALYWCTNWLPRVRIRVCDVAREDVALAWNAFHFDTRLKVDMRVAATAADPARPLFAGAALYGAIASGGARHLRLAEAAQAGVPALVAIQFPEGDWSTAEAVRLENAAFDARRFADELRSALAPVLDRPQ